MVVSCNEANILRAVVTLCELREDPEGRFDGLPTVVAVPAARSGLESNLVAIASPYTIPKNCLVRDSLQGTLAPPLYLQLEEALKRVFGWTRWPD